MFGIHAAQRAKRVLLRLCPFKMNMRKNANSTSKGERLKKKKQKFYEGDTESQKQTGKGTQRETGKQIRKMHVQRHAEHV